MPGDGDGYPVSLQRPEPDDHSGDETRLQKRYSHRFTFEQLKEEYRIAVQGSRGIPHSLSEALKK